MTPATAINPTTTAATMIPALDFLACVGTGNGARKEGIPDFFTGGIEPEG